MGLTVHELIAKAEAKGDLRHRWRHAEHLTGQRVAELLAVTLSDADREELRRLLGAPALIS